jgi:hypothetical protein
VTEDWREAGNDGCGNDWAVFAFIAGGMIVALALIIAALAGAF